MQKTRRWIGLVVGLALLGLGCGSEEESYRAENCLTVVDRVGEVYETCCTVACTAEYDHDAYQEACSELLTCTTASGAVCPRSVVLVVAFPACVY